MAMNFDPFRELDRVAANLLDARIHELLILLTCRRQVGRSGVGHELTVLVLAKDDGVAVATESLNTLDGET